VYWFTDLFSMEMGYPMSHDERLARVMGVPDALSTSHDVLKRARSVPSGLLIERDAVLRLREEPGPALSSASSPTLQAAMVSIRTTGR
jgi:hypothetical protein